MLKQLLDNADVYTAQLGDTDLQHKILVPIWQKPYWVSPPKMHAMKRLTDEMLVEDIEAS